MVSAHARPLLFLLSSFQPAEQAARRKAIGGERSQWASLLLACAVCGVGAALEAWKDSAACRVSTMSSIGTGVSLRAVFSSSGLKAARKPGCGSEGRWTPGTAGVPGTRSLFLGDPAPAAVRAGLVRPRAATARGAESLSFHA